MIHLHQIQTLLDKAQSDDPDLRSVCIFAYDTCSDEAMIPQATAPHLCADAIRLFCTLFSTLRPA